MNGLLLVEAGAAQTRSALIVDHQVRRFFFGPARGDENEPRDAEAGDVILARVKAYGAGGAFLDIGEARDAFLAGRRGHLPTIGSAIIVRIARPALREKGALASSDWRKIATGKDAAIEVEAARARPPARLGAETDAALSALSSVRLQEITKIVASDHESARVLTTYARGDAEVSVDRGAWERFACDDALETSLARALPIHGGGRMIIDEVAALTAIDIDAGPMASERRAAFNSAAAYAVFPEIARRSIGGQIVVDFLTPESGKDRAALAALLTSLQRETVGGRPGHLGADGLYRLVLPRTEKSLLERASRLCGNGWLRPGRTFNEGWLAVEAVRALERALLNAPSRRFHLRATSDILAHLTLRPSWLDRVRGRYGARFEIEELIKSATDDCEDLKEGGFEIVE